MMQRLVGVRDIDAFTEAILDLEEQFGYDTKYAMHIIRLYGEAEELHGKLEAFRSELEREKSTPPAPEKEQK